MSWILYLPIVLVLLVFLGTLFVQRSLMARSVRPLRLQYRLQWIAWTMLTVVGIHFLVRAFVSRPFAWGNFFGPACWAIVVTVTAFNLRRLYQKVLAEQPRSAPPPYKSPPLLWPLAVVLLPIIFLAVMAAWTLASDRLSARSEAKARAAEIASGVLATTEADFQIVQFEGNGYGIKGGQDVIWVNAQHELISPSRWTWPPKPAPLTAKNFSNLTTNKLAQWREAEKAFDASEWARAADLYFKFLDGRRQLPPNPMADYHAGISDSRFRPIAMSRRAVALEHVGDVPGAIAAYNDIFDGFNVGPERLAESGLSLEPIAVLKILDLAHDNPAALPEDWRRNPGFVVSQVAQNAAASPVSEEAIRRLRLIAPSLVDSSVGKQPVENLFDIWERSEKARRFYAAAASQLGTNAWPDNFWVKGSNEWLAVKQSPPEGWLKNPARPRDQGIYAGISGGWFWRQLTDRCAELDRHRDFVVVADVAGEKLSLSASPVDKNRFEAVDAQLVHSALQPISLSVRLANPETYFKAVRRRQILFVALIVGALLAGVAAAVTLRRSLLRQQALNDQKSNFVSSVSHELRAPIASVRLMAESLERGKVVGGEKQNEYFRFIVQECRRLSSLIENVLDFSRIEQGRKQYEFEPTNLLALTRETVKLMEPYAEEKGVKLIFETLNLELGTSNAERRTLNVEQDVDGRAIQQALVNLIDNAIKHSAKGQAVMVGLNAEPKMPVLLYVEDRGPGIPAAEHEKIFERFYRLGSELRRETQGVGIGLSIVRHIVAAHGGTVTVRSNPGAGSRFTIVLPNKNALTTDEHG